MSEFFGKKAGQGFKVLYNQQGQEAKKEKEVAAAGNQTPAEWKKTQENASFQFKQLKTIFGVLDVQLGKMLIPRLREGAKALGNMLHWVKENWSWVKALAGAVLVVSGALYAAAKAQQVYLGVTKLIAGASKAYALLTGATEEQTAAQVGNDAAMDANPVGAVILAITALTVAVVEVVKHWKQIKQVAAEVWTWIKGHYVLLGAILFGPFGFAAAEIIKHWHGILNFFTSVPGKIKSALSTVAHAIAAPFEAAFKWVEQKATALWHKIPSPIRKVLGSVAAS